MTPATIFDIATRLLGLIVLYRAIYVLPELGIAVSNLLFGGAVTACIDPLLTFLVFIGAAVWLIMGGAPLMRLAQLKRH